MHQRERAVTDPTPPVAPEVEPPLDIPEGIRQARAHLRRDLPALSASWWTRGKWACYSKDGRVAIGRDFRKLDQEALRRGLDLVDYIIERIEPGAGSDEEEDICR
jgi:hypothetical protein